MPMMSKKRIYSFCLTFTLIASGVRAAYDEVAHGKRKEMYKGNKRQRFFALTLIHTLRNMQSHGIIDLKTPIGNIK